MAISDSQKVDLLFKKLAFGKTKSDTLDNKSPSNEAIASPLLLRGDKVWKQSSDVPATPPSSDTSVVTLYNDAEGNSVETAEDTTSTNNRTWKTNLTDWIPTEFGPQYIVKVYVDDPSSNTPETTGTRIFPDGSGNNDSFVFDYQAGVLHFPDTNVPSAITGSKVPYVIGYRYTGEFGVGAAAGEDTNLGNLTISNVTLGTSTSGDPIILKPTGNGIVDIDTTTSLLIPTGNTQQRPDSPEEGYLRFNNETGSTEVYNGSGWENLGSQIANVTSQTLSGDDSTVTFTLNQDATAAGLIVSTNGVVQLPGTAYTVTGNQITFAEAPISSDTVDVRFTSAVTSINNLSNDSGENRITVTASGIADISTTHSLQLPSYTVTEANALSNVADGQLVYVSNGDGGNACLAVYSGGAWKISSLGANISSS